MIPSNKVQEYFLNPNDGLNKPEDYLDEKAYMRTNYLVKILRRYSDEEDYIMELGSGVGRNLSGLSDCGYKNLSGVEISKRYISFMKKKFPKLEAKIYYNSIENWLLSKPKRYQVMFTLAVLEHIPKESEWIFREIAKRCNILITIEDERSIGSRHFPRHYGKIFKEFGFKQVFAQILGSRQGLGCAFICRVQKKVRSRSMYQSSWRCARE